MLKFIHQLGRAEIHMKGVLLMKKDFNEFLDILQKGYMNDLSSRLGDLLCERLKGYDGNQAKLIAEIINTNNAAIIDLLGKYHSWLND